MANTESVADALKNVVTWSRKNDRPLGGVIAAAGIGSAERVREDLSVCDVDLKKAF